MTAANHFAPPDDTVMMTALVLQDIKDALSKRKNLNQVTIDASSTNDYFWARFDPLDEDQWFDEDYGDVREMPSFSTNIANEKQKVLNFLKDRGVIRSIGIKSSKQDPLDMGWTDYEVIESFEIELVLSKFLKYYDSYTAIAKVALNEFLLRSGQQSASEGEIIDDGKETTDFTATIRLNSSSKTVRLTFNGKTKDVHKFRSKLDANYIALKNLFLYPDQAMTKQELGIPRTISAIKDIPKTMGFHGELKNIFFTIDSKNKTLALHPDKSVGVEEAEILRHYVNRDII